MQRQSSTKVIRTGMLLSALSVALGSGSVSAAQEAAEVAFVENVSGRVVALAAAKPTLLDALDVVTDGTRLDLQPNSELRICHYQMRQYLTLRGPVRASVSRDGVVVESNKSAVTAAGSCTAPSDSSFQGGIVMRGLKVIRVNDIERQR
jgi:hypothetical protein